ncbi:TVP38/TMEM64 family protein [Rhodocyclus purpureus]|uniref:TVP38/TMEM64 family protein n=1 Tax=Rhodocyclus purpureus TaxID=1067 RepID=UPI001914CED9|nr:VTT domain-containing protein [Rhodocyclus purpureus]MBK5915307.1 hypothetical protein [Rhodocyclus purpureus]
MRRPPDRPPQTRALRIKAAAFVLLVLALIGSVIAWRWTSLGEWLEVDRLVHELRRLGAGMGPLAALGAIVVASVVAVPLGVIIVVAAIVFGPWAGSAYVLIGASLGAATSFALGKALGHGALRVLAGERVNALSERLARRGIVAMIVIRMLPIAPFAVVNMVAGASHLRLGDFLIGTLLGMIPGTLLIAWSVEGVVGLLGGADVPQSMLQAAH